MRDFLLAFYDRHQKFNEYNSRCIFNPTFIDTDIEN